MKNKILLGVIIALLMTGSFFAGVYFEKQKLEKEFKEKTQNSQTTPTLLISPTQEKLTVVEVTDGDTLKLSNGKVFRLYGVNAPEKNEPFYKESVDFTKSLVLNKEITFEQEEKYKEDKFGRILGYVFVDEKHLNLELVKAGLARVVLYEKRAKIKYQDELVNAENEAKLKKLGIWGGEVAKENLVYNFGEINFPYEKNWQMIENQKEENTINFFIKSLCINKEVKPTVVDSEMNCDITVADYQPLKEQKSILNLYQFINFISSQGQDDTLPTPFSNTFVNDNSVSITKWVGPHALTGQIIEGYFFEYMDQNNQKHFVHLFGNPVRISANDVLLKSFVYQIVKSVGTN